MTGQKLPSVTWPIVALVAVAVAGLIGIYYVAGPSDRGAILAMVSPVCSAIVAAFLARKVGSVENKVDTISDNTNGNLDRRIRLAVRQVINNPGQVDSGQSKGDSRPGTVVTQRD